MGNETHSERSTARSSRQHIDVHHGVRSKPKRSASSVTRVPVKARTTSLSAVLVLGAPRGSRNGNYTNGNWTAEAIEERRWLRSLYQLIAAARLPGSGISE